MDFAKGNANGGSSFGQQQSYVARKLTQYQTKVQDDLDKKKREIESSIAERSKHLGELQAREGKEFESDIKRRFEELGNRQKLESKKLEDQIKDQWKALEIVIKKDYENLAKQALPPHLAAAKQQEIASKVSRFQQEQHVQGQNLQMRFLQEQTNLQQLVATEQQNLQQRFVKEQMELQSKIQAEMKEIEDKTRKTIEYEKNMLFEPDPKYSNFRISMQQKMDFQQKGYIKVPGVVPKELLQNALRMVNYALSLGFKKEDVITFRQPEIEGCDAIVNLFYKSPLLSLIRSMIGNTHPCWGGQIAVRFPGHFCIPDSSNHITPFMPVPDWHKHWHIDGLSSETDTVPKGEIRNFTCLVGVLLNDLPETLSGNLAVYPGSHKKLEQIVKQQGPKILLNKDVCRTIDLGQPEQITGSAGDVVIVHYQTAHNVAPNMSHSIRYAVYFRVYSIHHEPEKFRPEAMVNIWKDWENLNKS